MMRIYPAKLGGKKSSRGVEASLDDGGKTV